MSAHIDKIFAEFDYVIPDYQIKWASLVDFKAVGDYMANLAILMAQGRL
jgi:hypothetical protein